MFRTCLLLALLPVPLSAAVVGYYRQPALHGDTIVFVSEGDLWMVSVKGGTATRVTTHAGDESLPAISPDGKTLAFTARYEGRVEVYTMPLAGGRPTRQTYDAQAVSFVGWTPGGKLLYSTRNFSTLPSTQLVTIDLTAKGERRSVVPLAQAADGCYDADGKVLFFTRLPFQGSHTKRYKGGTAQNIWKFADGADEAEPLTASYTGTSKSPMWHDGRVHFVSDRDGTMNLWSMRPDGTDLKQHTKHRGWDVASPCLSGGRVVYQLGADLWLHDLASGKGRKLDITLNSDLDQTRRQWVKKPTDFLTAAHLSPTGDHVALTARGQVFVMPRKAGRLVQASTKEGVRHRNARFLPDGKTVVSLSDESGEVELWTMPANGLGQAAQLTTGGKVLRWNVLPSPDGKYIAHHDKDQRLYLYDVAAKKDRQIDEAKVDDFADLAWSPDGKWLAYVAAAANTFSQIKLHGVADGKARLVTSDRYNSFDPAWSPDGKWLYFLSDRNLKSVVPSPWGSYQPEPFLDRKTKVYALALQPGQRSPFQAPDELSDEKPEAKEVKGPKEAKKPAVTVAIDFDGLPGRLHEVPVPAGNYSSLQVNDKALFWMSRQAGDRKAELKALAIGHDDPEVKTVTDDLSRFELSADGKRMLIQKTAALYVIDAAAGPASLLKKGVDLSGWSLSVVPRDEWRQMFDEAWRLERDYFYDRGMHGVDWKAMREKYRPLVDRVQSRAELSDVIAQMVSELAALHIFVRGGATREVPDSVATADLGARWERDPAAGGYRITHIYQHDPDEPDLASPLARPGVNVKVGDVIEAINGTETLSVADPLHLLLNRIDRQVLLRVRPAGGGKPRQVVVKPISPMKALDLRYHEWEHTRRLAVEKASDREFGYVHLRAMGGSDYGDFARHYYPSFNRKGLIIDVRDNRGGNIDSWVLSRLLRKPWFYWSQRVGQAPRWNMQWAFRGHVVVLVNENTASDGEAFAEGARRLGIAKVIGTRTWGGEIWLTSSNFLVDRGIATSAEFGVYGPEGTWLIEGHGVDPDIVVDNKPHATFKGKDAQLEAAIAYLRKRLKEKPVPDPVVPKHPDKSFPERGAAEKGGR